MEIKGNFNLLILIKISALILRQESIFNGNLILFFFHINDFVSMAWNDPLDNVHYSWQCDKQKYAIVVKKHLKVEIKYRYIALISVIDRDI